MLLLFNQLLLKFLVIYQFYLCLYFTFQSFLKWNSYHFDINHDLPKYQKYQFHSFLYDKNSFYFFKLCSFHHAFYVVFFTDYLALNVTCFFCCLIQTCYQFVYWSFWILNYYIYSLFYYLFYFPIYQLTHYPLNQSSFFQTHSFHFDFSQPYNFFSFKKLYFY